MIAGDAGAGGDRPDPNTRPCDGCGHIWFAGERRHEYSDTGSERHDTVAGRHEDVEVLCVLCRQQGRLAPADG